MNEREAFEALISAPPFERSIDRFTVKALWPGDYVDISVSLAWQAWKARSEMRDELIKAEREIERLRKGHERYETARRMNPRLWAEAWEENTKTGKPFDEIIDDLRPFMQNGGEL